MFDFNRYQDLIWELSTFWVLYSLTFLTIVLPFSHFILYLIISFFLFKLSYLLYVTEYIQIETNWKSLQSWLEKMCIRYARYNGCNLDDIKVRLNDRSYTNMVALSWFKLCTQGKIHLETKTRPYSFDNQWWNTII